MATAPMTWRRLGRLFVPAGERDWMASHAAMPTPHPLGGSEVRFYFASRDADNHPRVAWVDATVTPEGGEVTAVCDEPALDLGPPGHFDDNGVYPGPVLEQDGALTMYFVGRSNGTPPLYYMSIGLATSNDGGRSFERTLRAPVMGRSETDPWMVSTPCIQRAEEAWRMWYLAGIGWDLNADPPRSFYEIRYAESADGLDWRRDGLPVIACDSETTNIAAPTVERNSDGHRMWFSFTGPEHPYRIGYAESADGLTWQRHDEIGGLGPQGDGWESDAVAYPAVFRVDGRLYIAYSGNGFGREGFGVAIADD